MDIDSVHPPAQLVVRCPECGYERSMLAMFRNAVEMATKCERCPATTEIIAAYPVSGFGCSCCS
jgi:hypothetical protein